MAVPPRIDDFALATVAARPDKAGGPPPQFYELRDNLTANARSRSGDAVGYWSVSSLGGGLVDAGRRRRALLELGLAVVSAGLAGLTLLWPEWIEGLFGVEPDRGSGAAEWGIVFALLLIAVLFGVLGRLDLRHAMQGQRQAGPR